jgi:CIC family chloride channel protein
MGIGYDTVELTVLGEIGLGMLVVIAVAKLVATTACVSLGLPGGLIGPTLVMGAAAGGALGVVGHALVPEFSSSEGFYAMLGMGAMMGATLQAPLAALMAILELTANPNSILPGMFAIVTATLTTRVVFKRSSIFISMLEARGLEYQHDPVAISLGRTGVGAVIQRRLVSVARRATRSALPNPQDRPLDWVLLTEGSQVVGLVPGDAFATFLQTLDDDGEDIETFDLLEIEGASTDFSMVRLHATLREAIERMRDADTRIVLVTRVEAATPGSIYGVLTRDQIEASVRYRDLSRPG